MSDAHSSDISKHLRLYIGVFLALLVGTVVTVGMYYVHFESVALTVTIALVIATVKASLVALFFMHLSAERRSIYTFLGLTVFFFAGLMGLTVWALNDFPALSVSTQQVPVLKAPHSNVP